MSELGRVLCKISSSRKLSGPSAFHSKMAQAWGVIRDLTFPTQTDVWWPPPGTEGGGRSRSRTGILGRETLV